MARMTSSRSSRIAMLMARVDSEGGRAIIYVGRRRFEVEGCQSVS